MPYIALYRKYRPQDFDDIVGQRPIVTTLRNQIAQGKVGHAYLFCGMRGTGKTSTARVFAKALNCEKGPTDKPCDSCAACLGINHGSMMDVIEMDAASNRGIDDIRDLREKVSFPPAEGKYKVYIIDEVHMLTAEAFNALLKTLEEPPSFVVFILATTEPNKLPSTILSRCMRFDFTRVSLKDIAERLAKICENEGIEAEGRALSMIAAESQGSMRDALSLLDKAIAFGGDRLTYDDALQLFGGISVRGLYDVSRAVAKKDGARLLSIVEEVATQGKDMYKFLNDLLWHYRNLLMVKIGAKRELLDMMEEDYIEIAEIAKEYSREKLLTTVDILQEAAAEIKWVQNPRIVAEAALVKLTLPEMWDKTQGYISRIEELENTVRELEAKLEEVAKGAPPRVADDPLPTLEAEEEPPNYSAEVLSGDPQASDAGETFGRPLSGENPGSPVGPTSNSPQNPAGASFGRPPTSETAEDKKLTELKNRWKEITGELSERGKKGIQSLISAGGISPYKIEGASLILCYNGNDFYKEAVENVKNTLEAIILEITGLDLRVARFVDLKELKSSSEKTLRKERAKENDPLVQKVINFFGENIVEVEE